MDELTLAIPYNGSFRLGYSLNRDAFVEELACSYADHSPPDDISLTDWAAFIEHSERFSDATDDQFLVFLDWFADRDA
jgi:hypothetical protein